MLSRFSREELYLAMGAVTPEGREAYATWLDAAGDPRGEALRLGDQLARAYDPALAARLQTLLEELDADWWWVISERRIHNCGAAPTGARPQVRFRLRCERTWAELAPTDEARASEVRRCDHCAQNVYRCDTGAEAAARARRGECIAVPAGMAHDEATDGRALFLGRPDYVELWGRRLFPDDA